MKIEIIECLEDNFSYLLIDEITKSAVVIDPSEAKPVINKIESLGLKLKFIMNTHHHYDHVGGNKELKKLYNAGVVGFHQDRHRIPEIDILVKNDEIWKDGIFETKVFHIPGHTLGHVCFYFFKENALFSGDTLFSLGCGRVFEGTHKDMFNSLQLIKNLPLDTEIYCGHEYTLKNSEFCLKHEPENKALISKIKTVKNLLSIGKPTIPSTLEEEMQTNIFLRSKNVENFSKLRDLKDNF